MGKLNKENIKRNIPYFVQVTFEDKFGKKFKNKQRVFLGDNGFDIEYYPNLGVRKALLLTRYVILIKQWIKDKNDNRDNNKYKAAFKEFKGYFENEMKFVKDDTLKQEIDILDKLIKF